MRVARLRRKQGKEPPKAIADMPRIRADALDAWECFGMVTRTRQMGFSVSPVALGEVRDWCDLHGVAVWRRPALARIVKALEHKADRLLRERDDASPRPRTQ